MNAPTYPVYDGIAQGSRILAARIAARAEDSPSTRQGPWLPNVQDAPSSYMGPLVYGSGRIFGLHWGR